MSFVRSIQEKQHRTFPCVPLFQKKDTRLQSLWIYRKVVAVLAIYVCQQFVLKFFLAAVFNFYFSRKRLLFK